MRELALESSGGEEIIPCDEYKEGRLDWLLRFSRKKDEDGLTVVSDMSIHVETDQIWSLFLLETRSLFLFLATISRATIRSLDLNPLPFLSLSVVCQKVYHAPPFS